MPQGGDSQSNRRVVQKNGRSETLIHLTILPFGSSIKRKTPQKKKENRN